MPLSSKFWLKKWHISWYEPLDKPYYSNITHKSYYTEEEKNRDIRKLKLEKLNGKINI